MGTTRKTRKQWRQEGRSVLAGSITTHHNESGEPLWDDRDTILVGRREQVSELSELDGGEIAFDELAFHQNHDAMNGNPWW